MAPHEQTLVTLARAACAGDIGTVARAFDYPAALYVDDDILPLANSWTLRELLDRFHKVLLEAGVIDVRVEVAARSLPRGALHSAWIEKSYLDAAGRLAAHAHIRVFYSTALGQPALRLVEIIEAPFAGRIAPLCEWLRGLSAGQSPRG